jgi:hypothetical protein
VKLLSIDLSRLTRLAFAARLSGQLYLPVALTSFLDRYQFLKYPEDLAAPDRLKMEFRHGLFDGTAIDSLDIYNDGIAVSARSNTEILDRFTDDLFDFMQKDWGVDLVRSHRVDRMYESTLTVSTEVDVLAPLRAYQSLAGALQEQLSNLIELDAEFEPYGFSLAPDPSKIAALKPSGFRLERRLAIGYEFNQYFSLAPLRTNDHLALLTSLENSL